jgi:hypothetical protein
MDFGYLQIRARFARFFLTQYIVQKGKLYQIATKLPNGPKIYLMAICSIFQMAIEYNNLFYSKALQK